MLSIEKNTDIVITQCDGDIRIIIEKLLDNEDNEDDKKSSRGHALELKGLYNTLALLIEHNKVSEVLSKLLDNTLPNYNLLQGNCQHLTNFVENGLNELAV